MVALCGKVAGHVDICTAYVYLLLLIRSRVVSPEAPCEAQRRTMPFGSIVELAKAP